MTGEEFLKAAAPAVEFVAGFLDQFPELYCVLRIKGKFGVIVIGLEDHEPDDEAPP